MDFQDIAWLETLFEKLIADASRAKTKQEIITMIRQRYLIIREKRLEMADQILRTE